MSETSRAWWDRFPVAVGQVLRWHIGPTQLFVERRPEEWRVALAEVGEGLEADLEVAVPVEGVDLLEMDDVSRFALSDTAGEIELAPALADRPVVSRPQKPVSVPPGREVVLYVGSPLWVRLVDGSGVELDDRAVFRPSDTWFGSDTRSGDLCYASRTFGRTSLDELPVLPHRALTPVRIVNRADSPLELERVNLPVLHLSLFVAADGRFWTEAVTLARDADSEFSPLDVTDGPPADAPEARRVAEPRSPRTEAMVFRAFSNLLGALR